VLDAYLDEECSAEESAVVQKHLADCDDCALYCAHSSMLISDLKSMPKLQFKKEIDFSFLDASSECAQISELLSAYHDREIDSEERLKVEAHLSSCQPCSGELQSISGLVQSLKNLPRYSAPADIVEKIDLQKPSSFPHNCGSISEMLDAYHDNELADAEASQVRQHLSNCNDCTGKLENIESLASGLKSLPRLFAPHDIVEKIDFSKADTAKSPAPVQLSAQRQQKHSNKRVIWYGLGGAVAAAVVLVFSLSHSTNTVGDRNLALKPSKQAGPELAVSPIKNDETAETNPKSTPETTNGSSNSVQEPIIAESSKQDNKTSAKDTPSQIATAKDTKPAPQTAPKADDTLTELALIPDTSAASADALGIGTDEDGLYDIKI